jgi:hypothetical protein
MKKGHLYILMICFLVLSLAGFAHGWQGRMGGMGNPYGLVEDESDFLIHPFGIANGEGLKFYGGYSFKYRDVLDWDYTLTTFSPTTGVLREQWPFRGSGDEIKHDALAGAAFPLGLGRMGLFFNYVGKRGDFSGRENEFDNGSTYFHEYDLKSDLDAFSLRLLYGLPLGNVKIEGLPMGIFKFGGEIELAYRNEENKSFFNRDFNGLGTRIFKENSPFGEWQESRNTLPFEFPYDSRYWEVFLKGSLGGTFDPARFAFTTKVGFVFGGDNRLEHNRLIYPAGITSSIEMDGGVSGWSIESDFWLRYALSKDLSLPFLARIGFQKKTRDGSGQGFGFLYDGQNFDYKEKESSLYAEIGGGLDKELLKGTRIAAGFYYAYLHDKYGYGILRQPFVPSFNLDQSEFPNHKEHQLTLKLTGEKEFSPSFTMRMGINLFYGWVKENFDASYTRFIGPLPSRFEDTISINGGHWGVALSLGGTVKFQRYNIEPFFNLGYQKQDLNGDGDRITSNPFLFNRSLEMDKLMKDWSIGGGFSVKF